jgi:hypothetical protein
MMTSDVEDEPVLTRDTNQSKEDAKDQGGHRSEIRKRLKTALGMGPS